LKFEHLPDDGGIFSAGGTQADLTARLKPVGIKPHVEKAFLQLVRFRDFAPHAFDAAANDDPENRLLIGAHGISPRIQRGISPWSGGSPTGSCIRSSSGRRSFESERSSNTASAGVRLSPRQEGPPPRAPAGASSRRCG